MKGANLIWLSLYVALTATFAQAEELPTRGPIPFATYDKDKSGSISPEEFYGTRGERMGERAQEGRPMLGAASAPSFEEFDADNNGQLSEAELSAGQQAQMQQRRYFGAAPGDGQSQRQIRSVGGDATSFTDFDLDSDGQVTLQEFDEAQRKLLQEGGRAGRQLPAAFGDIDTNDDGIITAEEFIAHKVRVRGSRPVR